MRCALTPRKEAVVIVTDPGPDPDDIKALLIAAVAHHRLVIDLVAVVANGGCQPGRRAKLARCVLDRLGLPEVRVGAGSQGKSYDPMPHEYNIDGYDSVDEDRLEDGATLLLDTIKCARPKSLHVVCISSMRDAADAISGDSEAFERAVRHVSIQGGVISDKNAPFSWRADETAVNCAFDVEAANLVVHFCLERGVPMTVCSRDATPMLPMQLARSYALRTKDEIMRYLADAQFLGLAGLWRKLCAGLLPARCSKEWYFETFCGVSPGDFHVHNLGNLSADAEIVQHLDGYVKPYDVLAVMAVLPTTSKLIADCGTAGGTPQPHRFLLGPDQMIPAVQVASVLRETYRVVVQLSSRSAVATLGDLDSPPSRSTPVSPQRTRVGMWVSSPEYSPFGAQGRQGLRRQATWAEREATDARSELNLRPAIEDEEVSKRLSECLDAARKMHDRVARASMYVGLALLFASAVAFAALTVYTANARVSTAGAPGTAGLDYSTARALAALLGLLVILGAFIILVSLFPTHSHRRRITMSVLMGTLLSYATAAATMTVILTPLPHSSEGHAAIARAMSIVYAVAGAIAALTLTWGLYALHSTPGALLRLTWLVAGISSVVQGLAQGLIDTFDDRVTLPTMLWSLATKVVCVVIGALMLVQSARARLQILVARALAVADTRGALAAFLGFGTADVWDARTVVHQARSVFAPVRVDDATLNNLAAAWHGADSPSPIAARKRSRGGSSTQVVPGDDAAERSQPLAATEAAPSGNQSMGDDGRSRPKLRALGAVPSSEIAMAADWFIVYSPLDPWEERLQALRGAATDFEKSVGRPPVAWIVDLCADPGLGPAEILGHLPFNMSRCARLLIVAGPHFPVDKAAVAILFAWRALGRGVDSIDALAALVHEPAETIAAFDAFHASQAVSFPTLHDRTTAATASSTTAAGDVQSAAAARERMLYALELAGPGGLEEAVHSYTPVIKRAALGRSPVPVGTAVSFRS